MDDEENDSLMGMGDEPMAMMAMEDEQSKVQSNVTIPQSIGLFSSLKQDPSEQESQALLKENGTPREEEDEGESEKRQNKIIKKNIPDPKIKRNRMGPC